MAGSVGAAPTLVCFNAGAHRRLGKACARDGAVLVQRRRLRRGKDGVDVERGATSL